MALLDVRDGIKSGPPHDVVNMGRPDDVPNMFSTAVPPTVCRFIYVLYKGKPLDRPVPGGETKQITAHTAVRLPCLGATNRRARPAGFQLPRLSGKNVCPRNSPALHLVSIYYPAAAVLSSAVRRTVIFRRFYAFRICLICSRFSANQIPSCRSFVESPVSII